MRPLNKYRNVTQKSAQVNMFTNGGTIRWAQITSPTPAEDIYVHLYDVYYRSGAMAFTDAGGGAVLCTLPQTMGKTLSDLGLAVGDEFELTISDTTSYNGAETCTVISKDSFTFVDTYVADEASGTLVGTVVAGTTVPDFSLYIPGSTADKGHGIFNYIGEKGAGLHFSQACRLIITTTVTGSTGAPTANCAINALYE